MGQGKFFRVFSQNPDYVDKICNDMENPFDFACQRWFNQKN